jgi:hypothetical protein
MCRELSARGFVLGGSTGTVLAGARRWLLAHPEETGTVSVAISADGGERYLASLYDDDWVSERFGVEEPVSAHCPDADLEAAISNR